MKNNPKPSTWMLLGGGVLLFIASFLHWVSYHGLSGSGLDTDYAPGLLGLWCLIIGAGIAILVALTTFGNVKLPAHVLGFSWNQLFLMLGFAAFLITFGRQFGPNVGIGVTLGWIGAAVIVVGAFMEIQTESKAAAVPPTRF